LYAGFVEHPDEGARSFDEKLRDQLAPCSDDAKQLMAELLAFHLLITKTITGSKKAKIVNNVLGWMRQRPPLPLGLVEAFELGFINPGTYYNTGRPVQLQYLITLGRAWKSLDRAERDAALDDPWQFKAVLGDLHGTGAGTQRHALLHLLFPETYEAIVSDDHFGKILKRFSSALSGKIGRASCRERVS
jgi:5-methylcytosine-specific restriction protein B